MAQDAIRCFLQVDAAGVERFRQPRDALHVAQHLRRFAQQRFHREVDRADAKLGIGHHQPGVFGRRAQHRKGTTLALADRAKALEILRGDAENIALLRFVAPDLARRHASVLRRNRAQVEARAAARRVGKLGHRVRQTARPHVVDREHRIGRAELPAPVDHFLRAPLYFGVAPLHRIEIQVLRIGARAHAGSRAAAHSDQHARSAELDQQRPRRQPRLGRLRIGNIPDAAREHDRLMVAALEAGHLLLERAEVAGEVRPAELVVERRRAYRAFDHYVEGRYDPVRPAVVLLLPRLHRAGDAQVRDREAGKSRLGLGSAPRGALVANLAARAGRSARERRDRGRVIVRLALHHRMRQFRVWLVDGIAIGIEALRHPSLHDRGIVRIREHRTLRIRRVGVLDHAEEGVLLSLSIDDPGRVEDLVAAMLGIGLRKHRELGIGGITTEARVGIGKVVDLIG